MTEDAVKSDAAEELGADKLLRLYRLLVLTRKFEETLIRLYHSGRVRGHPHSSIGQEAVGVGATFALEPDDLVCPSLRTVGAILAKGVPSEKVMAEAFRKKTGPSGGKYLYHHLGDLKKGVLLGSAVVGGAIPVAVGTALAAKLQGTGKVSMVFFGDGASSRGDFHEGLNMAAVLNVPVVFVCENNLYALSTPQNKQMKIKDIADRAQGYGMPGVTVDGGDALAVLYEAKDAVDRARRGEGPTLIECKTYRWRAHSEIDDPDMERPQDELVFWRDQCRPIHRLREYLGARDIIDPERVLQIDQDVDAELEAAVSFAEQSPDPVPDEVLTDVYK